jgi:hypothetical protein
MAVSPPVSPSAGVALFRRTKPKDITPPRTVTPLPPEESVHVPTPAPAPATSESPVNKDDSEAWVTEERRF